MANRESSSAITLSKREHSKLVTENQRLVRALQEIADPISFWKANLEPGYDLDVSMCMKMADSPETYKDIARKALTGSTNG